MITYTVLEDDPDLECRYQCPGTGKLDDLAALDCAEHFHDFHVGFESGWPIVIVLFGKDDDKVAGRFRVEREYSPTFSATEVTGEEADDVPPSSDV